jgi:DNA-binding NarL/FixJ family response regulator
VRAHEHPRGGGDIRPRGFAVVSDGNSTTSENARLPIRVLMAHHPFLTREFLTAVCTAAPDVELVAVCSNATELDAAITAWRPDVVLTDIRIPPSGAHDGIRVATRLRDTNPETGVVVLSQYADPSCALGLFERGTRRRAYLLTERIRNREELVEAIQTVAKGGSVIDPLIVDMLIQARSRASHSQLSELTPREREVLAEIGAGKTNGAIAESLVLTKRAVEKHVHSIFSKLDLPQSPDVSRRVQATLLLLSEEEDEAAIWKETAPARRSPPLDGSSATLTAATAPRAPGRTLLRSRDYCK